MGMLRQHREALGFSVDEVAAAARWSRSRQRAIERDDDLESHEGDRLTDLLGVDVEALLCGERVTEQPVAALLKASAAKLDAGSRFSIVEATSVARQVRDLQRALGRSTRWDRHVRTFQSNPDYGHPEHGTPERLASNVRTKLRLGSEPIASISRNVLDALDVLVLWDRLPEHIDALSFADPDSGFVVVGNVAGKHMGSAYGRRITWAHEICHLLFDRAQMRSVGQFCTIARPRRQPRNDQDTRYAIERRARAFAAYLLAPRADIVGFWKDATGRERAHRVRAVMDRYGMGYEATRSHLANVKLLGIRAKVERVRTAPGSSTEDADPLPDGVMLRHNAGVSLLRAGALFELAWSCVEEGVLSEEGAREHLRLDIAAWSNVRNALGLGTSEGCWHTSSAHLREWP